MTAVRATDPELNVTTAAATPRGAPQPAAPRRAGTARRQSTTAGQNRRQLQRDLDIRAASLRINRRVSGPAGGIARPGAAPAPDAARPAMGTPVAPRSTSAHSPSMLRQPASMPAAAQPARVVAPAPAPAPAVPRTRPFVVLPGGASSLDADGRRRLSTPAVVITALVTIVLTIGLIVAAQIRVTQMNEQIGADLATTSQLQRATTGLQEQISALATTARIDHEAARRQLIEPDPVDVTYLSAGNRAQTAERAARALRDQPLNPAGGPKAASTTVAPGTEATNTLATTTP